MHFEVLNLEIRLRWLADESGLEGSPKVGLSQGLSPTRLADFPQIWGSTDDPDQFDAIGSPCDLVFVTAQKILSFFVLS